MRKRITLAATLAIAAIGIGASSASAATLYTTSAHTTAVPVGTTITATIPAGKEWTLSLEGGGAVEVCFGGTLALKVTQNSAGVVKAEVTGGTFAPNCVGLAQMSASAGGELQISGSSVANGSNSAWLGSTLKGVHWALTGIGSWTGNFTSATGSPPAKGVFSQQPTTAKAPVSVVLANAKKLDGTPWSNPEVSATYTFTGTAAAYSLG
jgi:hypothetical protein